MFLSKLSINRPIMVTMGIMVCIVFGVIAYRTLALNLMPKLNLPNVTIQTVYSGASPKEIESQVTKKIEDEIATISNLDFIQSYSMENISIIIVAFKLGTDQDIAKQDVKDKVDGILNDLPEDADLPVVAKSDINDEPVLQVVLSGNISGRDLYELADKRIKDRFSQIEGVAQVQISGGEEREVHVELNNRTVYENELTPAQLSQILAASNLDMPGGSFKEGDQDYAVRLSGKFLTVEELAQLKIPTAKGPRYLRDIANIKDTSKKITERTTYFTNDDKIMRGNVVRLQIMKTSEGNTVKIAHAVKDALPEINQELPKGTNLAVVDDPSLLVESSVDDTMSNVYMGILLTGLVLLFFLHDFRSTLIVALAMPTSIISTFLLMKAAGFTMNIMSLMGLSTSTGVLVSNSVVVLENIFRHKELGHKRKEAADIGTAEVTVAVLASTLTNIVVFLPLGTMSSLAGQFLTEFGLTVVFATIFSLIISFTLTPMLASLILPDKQKKNKLGEAIELMFSKIERVYAKSLHFAMDTKKRAFVTILTSLIALVLTFVLIAPKIGFEFIPLLDEGNIKIETELPLGYNLDETAKVMNQIQAIVSEFPEVKNVLTDIGSISPTNEGTNLAVSDVKLVDVKERKKSTQQVNEELIKKFALLPNAKIKSIVKSSVGNQAGSGISFFLIGQDMEKLQAYRDEILEKGKKIQGLINFDSSLRSGKPEIQILPDRDKLADAGLTVYDIALTIRSSMDGINSTVYSEKGNDYDLNITYNENSLNTLEEIKNISITGPSGPMRLSQLAQVNLVNGVNSIRHRDKLPAIEFTGDPAEGVPLGNVTNDLNKLLDEMHLDSGYKIKWEGNAKLMNETTRDMMNALMLAILLTYMLLAATLESFKQPLYILMTLPLAMIGVFLALYLTGTNMGMFAMMSVVMLVGIVVNNAILQLDYTNILVGQGKNTKEALLEACPVKFKPILMSTLAIILGMLPMALGMGSSGKEMRQPMGIVTIGGLIVSTALTLYVVPALVYFFTREKKEIA